jgi:hypothetical protein
MSEGSNFLHRTTESVAITVLVALLIAAPTILYLNNSNKNLQGKELTLNDLDFSSTELSPLDPTLAKKAEETLSNLKSLKNLTPTQKRAVDTVANDIKKHVSSNNTHFVQQSINAGNNLASNLGGNTGSGATGSGEGSTDGTGTGDTGAGSGDTGTGNGNGDNGTGNGDPDPSDDYGWASARAGRPVQADTCSSYPTLRANPIVVSPSGGDNDNEIIQQAVNQGIAEGRDVRLSEGTFRVKNSISIPRETNNFRILGAGSDKTKFITTSPLTGNLFRIGNYNIQSHNNWGISNLPQIEVDGRVEDNAKTATISEGQSAPVVGQWYALWDQQYFQHPQWRVYVTGEMLKVTAYNPATRQVTFDINVGRTYGREAKLANLDKFTNSDIAVGGFTYDAFIEETSEWSKGVITAGMSLRLKVHDIKVIHFDGVNFNLSLCRECDISKIDQTETQSRSAGAGAGYGIVFSRSRLSTICDSDSRGGRMRHNMVSHTGSMDLNYIRVGGRVDGRMTSLRLYGNQSDFNSFTIGNGYWSASNVLSGGSGGGSGHRIENSNNSNLFWILANSDDIMYRNIKGTGIALDAFGSLGAGPIGKYTMLDSELNMPTTYWGAVQFGIGYKSLRAGEGLFINTTLNHINIANQSDSAQTALQIDRDSRPLNGDLEFRNCTLHTRDYGGFAARIRGGELPEPRALKFIDSTFISDRAQGIHYLEPSLNLSLTLTNNTFKTKASNIGGASTKLINVPDDHTMTYFEETGTKIEARQ